MTTNHKIQMFSYNSEWPLLFQKEAEIIKNILKDNCIGIEHIGSTSIIGLSAKPIIDIMVIVKNISNLDKGLMEDINYKFMGEYGIPFRQYFQKGESIRTHHVHIYEKDNPEIERHIKFRDWMRNNPRDAEEYNTLKKSLAKKFPNDIFSYCAGKEVFIKEIERKTKFNKIRFIKALTPYEWEKYHRIRKEQIFNRSTVIYDPNHPTMSASNHFHFVLYHGQEIVTVAHVEYLKGEEVALRSIATDEPYKNKGYGHQMMQQLEKWLRYQGKKVIKVHAYLGAEDFYRKLGYSNMVFNDISISKDVVDLGKML